jgi:VanZ family protein
MPGHTVFKIVSLLAFAGVLVVSFLPSDTVDPIRVNFGRSIDIGHIVAYALVASATMLSVPRQALTLRRGAGIVFTISLVGLAIELLQPLVGRTTSVVDFAENEAGIAGGVVIFCGYLFAQRFRTKGSDRRPDGA